MSIFQQLRDSLYDSFSLVLADYYPTTPIIFSHQDGDEPNTTYLDLQEISVEQVGRVQTSTRTEEIDDDGIIRNMLNTQAHYETVIQVGFVGSQSGNIAYDLHHLINTTPMWEKFQLHNLYPIRKSEVRRSPLLRETKWVERFLFDVTFTYSVSTNQEVDVIENFTHIIQTWGNGVDWFLDKYGEDFTVVFTDKLQYLINEKYPEIFDVYSWFLQEFGEEFVETYGDKINELINLIYPSIFN